MLRKYALRSRRRCKYVCAGLCRRWPVPDAANVRTPSPSCLAALGPRGTTGIAHVRTPAPALSIRQAWWDLAGYARLDGIKNPEAVARYVAKYAGKKAAWAPCVWGFGLLRAPSFSQTLRRGRGDRF